MTTINLAELRGRELVPGYTARFVHTEHITMSYVDIAAGALLPEHSHPHEQISSIVEGRFELTIAGEAHVLEPGIVAVIPPNVPHSGRALSDCRIWDVFYPVREDYRDLQ